MHEGKPHVDAFVVLHMDEDVQLQLFAVTTQLGIDKRGYHVLPNDLVAPPNRYHSDPRMGLMIVACGLPVGELEAKGKYLAEQLNAQLGVDWPHITGVTRPLDTPQLPRINNLQEPQ
jgi:hypothetical protein